MITEASQALKYGMWSRQPVASDPDEACLPRHVQNGVQNRKKNTVLIFYGLKITILGERRGAK